MKWFDKWFAKKVKSAWDDANSIGRSEKADQPELLRASRIDSSGMNFTVYRANGGYIVETRIYNRKRDSNDNGLHIVTDDKNLGEEIGQIITYENLRN